jgi:sortase A
VTSLTLGNVFEHLHDAHPGDEVQVLSDTTVFTYRVLEVRTVPRTDTSIVDPTPTPTLTLVTCTGLWNPALHDYMQRLVVRAELVGAAVDPPV